MPTTDDPIHRLRMLRDTAASALTEADLSSPTAAVTSLSAAREAVQQALDEAMALAVTLEGSSVRQVAALASIAPNSAAAHMARSRTLSGYSPSGRVDASAIARARHDHGTTPPMRFTPRRPTGDSP